MDGNRDVVSVLTLLSVDIVIAAAIPLVILIMNYSLKIQNPLVLTILSLISRSD